MKLDRALIKSQARELIKGKVIILFLIVLVVGILTGGISLFTSDYESLPAIFSGENLFESITSGNIPTTYSTHFNFLGIVSIICLPLAVTLAGMFLQFIRGTQFDIAGEFSYVFKNAFDKNYVQKFLLILLRSIFAFLWTLLFIVPGIVYVYKTYFIEYLMADNPNLTWQEAIELSKKLTKGHKGELFAFDLSFIPWFLLIAITAGLASIYVGPYYHTAKALLYENFKQRALQIGELNEQDFISNNEKMAQAFNNFGGTYQQNANAAAPVQPQYQAPTTPPPVAPVEEAPAAPAEETPSEAYYTPPADAQQYFTPLDGEPKDE